MQAPWTPEYGFTGHVDVGTFFVLIGIFVLIAVLKVWDAYHPEDHDGDGL
jgi:hypothetical protein